MANDNTLRSNQDTQVFQQWNSQGGKKFHIGKLDLCISIEY